MNAQQPFGRRRAEAPRRQSPAPVATPRMRAPEPDPISPPTATPESEPQEPEHPDATPEFTARPSLRERDPPRRRRKRWLAEPYRTFSIAASIGFGVSSWILPDSIQSVVQIVMGVLTVGGLAAGLWRSHIANAAADWSTS